MLVPNSELKTNRMFAVVIALLLAGLTTACDSGDQGDDAPAIQLTVLSPDREPFPHVPGASVVVYPGDEVDVRLSGFEPNEEVRVFSQHETYHRLAYRADSNGVVNFPVHVNPGASIDAYFFAVAQEPYSERYGKFATFLIVTLGSEFRDDPQFEVLSEVWPLIDPAWP